MVQTPELRLLVIFSRYVPFKGPASILMKEIAPRQQEQQADAIHTLKCKFRAKKPVPKKHKQLLTLVQHGQRLHVARAGKNDVSLDAVEAPAARDERREVALQRVEAAGHVDEASSF